MLDAKDKTKPPAKQHQNAFIDFGGLKRVIGRAWSLTVGLFLLALFVSFPIYRVYISLQLDAQGIPISCAVTSKDERINYEYDSWSRSNNIGFRCPWRGVNAPFIANMKVSEETYDRLHVGSQVQLRYLEHHPLDSLGLKEFRLADQHTQGWLIESWQICLLVAVLIGFVVAIAFAVKGFRPARWLLVGAIACLILWVFNPQTVPSPSGEQRTAEGIVSDVHHVTEILEGSESEGYTALQPYDIVALKFVPEKWDDPVLGVDQVDSGNMPRFKEGDRVRIAYSLEHPRHIAILDATHTYYSKNLLGLVVGAFLFILALLLFVVIMSILKRYVALPWFIPFGNRKKR
jgi:hypothetical protein